MAPRRVIADSDDEDGGDEEPTSPLAREAHAAPEPEPLSPQHDRPSKSLSVAPNSHNHVSDGTDQSFFAGAYHDHQSAALQQSHLIENIVRQSQRASGSSSGDVSLPAKGKGRGWKTNPSSGSDITSPVVLSRSGNQQPLLSDDATDFTTPRKSAVDDEWDVPSSAEGATTSRSAKASKGTKSKSYGKRRRSQSNLARGSAASAIFGSDDARLDQAADDGATLDEQPIENEGVESSSPLSGSKKRKISNYDEVVQDTANFYIAQSNMTTMQKLEYQRVSVPQTSYSAAPGSLGNQKSSGATTIAYSTPSRYASSGPPLPWERPSANDLQPDSPGNMIDLSSSPDIIASWHDRSKMKRSAAAATMEAVEEEQAESPVRSPTKTPSSKRGKKRPRATEDVDELGQDESWDSDAIGFPRESYKPRSSRRRSVAASVPEDDDGGAQDAVDATHEEVPEEAPDVAPEPTVEAPETPAADLEPVVDTAPEPDPMEAPPVTLPKKRGRKKKQPVVEEIPQDEADNESPAKAQEPALSITAARTEAPAEKPKKKRGRPRKSDTAKVEPVVVDPAPVDEEAPTMPEPNREDDAEPEEFIPQEEDPDVEEPKPKRKKKSTLKKQSVKSTKLSEPEEDRNASPLKEIDPNTRSPSKAMSAETPSATTEPAGEKGTPSKSEARETPKPAASASASQAKTPYRVGLSKRSRIAPLLKIIKK